MKISSFKSKTQSIPDRYSVDVFDEFDRIRTGYTKKIITELRAEPNKKKADTIKGTLPAVTFQGTFNTRSKNDLKQASGLLVLDYDKIGNPIEAKDLLSTNDYIFACWISPSGNGIKALVKIPIVESDEQYKSYYSSIQRQFNDSYDFIIDNSGKDISRLCFTSYDPDIFVNEDSIIWTDFDALELERPIISHEFVTVPCTDQEEIIRRLLKWFEGKYNPSQRNNSINILAYSFNLFGIDINTCKTICLRYEQKDFRANEILKTVESAYSKRESFGTQQFQDNRKKDYITSFSRGKSVDEVKKKFKEVSPEVIDEICNNNKEIVFWSENDKGVIKITHNYYRDYLHSLGFNKILFTNDTKVISFIRKEGKFVREYQPEEVKDYVLRDIENRGEMDVWNILAGSPKYFNENYLSMLESKVVDVEKDGEDYALFYYQNTVVKVKEDSIELIDYNELPKSVWETQVLKRDFKECDHHDSDFRTFIWNACGKDVDNYNAFKAVIGRMLHTYKTTSRNKAIIANDDDMSDTPNGGSGKSLLWVAVGKLRKVSDIDGKNFDFSKSFNYQTVPIDTQVLVYDDIAKNFDFERLFSVITGGLTVEYKSQNAIKLDVTESPQIYITTNYAVKGIGGSFDRRKHEIEFSSHYNSNYSPEDEFNKRFFDEWNDDEWARFDNYMINCLQFYLKNGLVKQSMTTILDKKFKTETSNDWYNFCLAQRFKLNKRYYKSELKSLFLEENDHYKDFTNKTFRNWISSFASFKMWNLTHERDHKGHYIEFNVSGVEMMEASESIEDITETDMPF